MIQALSPHLLFAFNNYMVEINDWFAWLLFCIQIRLAEAQQQKTPSQDMNPEQLEKLAKLEGWRQELKLLEGKKAEEASSWMGFRFSVRELGSLPFAFSWRSKRLQCATRVTIPEFVNHGASICCNHFGLEIIILLCSWGTIMPDICKLQQPYIH